MTIVKPKNQSLKDFAASVPLMTWVEIPASSITKEERLLIEGGDPMRRYMNALNHKSNRDLVVQMVSALEDSFSSLLQNFTVEKPGEQLFKRRGDVKDFGLRISLAYALGLISESETKRARSLAQIRNSFAHDAELFDFDHDEKVVRNIKQLRLAQIGSPIDIPLRVTFFTSALSLIQCLDARSKEVLFKRCKEHMDTIVPPDAPSV